MRLGTVAGPVIQATGKSTFEDGLTYIHLVIHDLDVYFVVLLLLVTLYSQNTGFQP
jgi:hypothetical protein